MKKRLILLLLVVLTFGIYAEDMNFVDYLLRNDSPEVAIYELNKIAFYEKNPSIRYKAEFKIAELYKDLGNYRKSISKTAEILNNYDLSEIDQAKLYSLLSLNYYGLNVLANSLSYIRQSIEIQDYGINKMYYGLYQAELYNWDESLSIFHDLAIGEYKNDISSASKDIEEYLKLYPDIDSKNVVFSGILSSLIPGSGQLYSGHLVDGIQAFSSVAVLSFITYASYKYENEITGSYYLTPISALLTSVFYISNIHGAVRTAKYHNIKRKENYLDYVREKVICGN